MVLSINPTAGSFVSPQGSYDSYTQGMIPVMVLGSLQGSLNVRCYVDEILVPSPPRAKKMKAQMSIRGSGTKLALDYVRMQPFVSRRSSFPTKGPSGWTSECCPLFLELRSQKKRNLYPGELVDVFIGE